MILRWSPAPPPGHDDDRAPCRRMRHVRLWHAFMHASFHRTSGQIAGVVRGLPVPDCTLSFLDPSAFSSGTCASGYVRQYGSDASRQRCPGAGARRTRTGDTPHIHPALIQSSDTA